MPGAAFTLAERLPPPRITHSGSSTRASIHSGRSSGSPNGVTPPSSIPVSRAVSSGPANDTRRTPSFFRTVLFTSSRVVASRTQAA
jgi:hypothetical protein